MKAVDDFQQRGQLSAGSQLRQFVPVRLEIAGGVMGDRLGDVPADVRRSGKGDERKPRVVQHAIADLAARADEGDRLGAMLIHSEGMRAVARTVRTRTTGPSPFFITATMPYDVRSGSG